MFAAQPAPATGVSQRNALEVSAFANQVAARLPSPAQGRLAENVMHFCRILRSAGLPLGPDRVLRAVEALEVVGLDHKLDVYAALSAVLLDRHEHREIFNEAFHVFWRDPKLLDRMMYLMLPKVSGRGRPDDKPNPQRLIDGFAPKNQPAPQPKAPKEEQEIQLDATLTFSERERLSQVDFESMSTDEYAQARALVQKLPLPTPKIRTRRFAPATRGALDLRRALQQWPRDPYALALPKQAPAYRTPPLVVLVDISGSMHRYSRMFMHYLHALTLAHPHVHTLTLGTRLTNVTRCLRHRDADVALAQASATVQDWSGGTRLGSCLEEFNQRWSRRLLSGNAGVLLLTDGLDREDTTVLREQMRRLRLAAHHIVWLNPLLRYKGFEAKPAGIRAMLPFVDRFLPAHNLDSLRDLAKVLSQDVTKAALPLR